MDTLRAVPGNPTFHPSQSRLCTLLQTIAVNNINYTKALFWAWMCQNAFVSRARRGDDGGRRQERWNETQKAKNEKDRKGRKKFNSNSNSQLSEIGYACEFHTRSLVSCSELVQDLVACCGVQLSGSKCQVEFVTYRCWRSSVTPPQMTVSPLLQQTGNRLWQSSLQHNWIKLRTHAAALTCCGACAGISDAQK